MTQTKEMFTDPPAFPGRATASRDQRFFTNHESRLFFAMGARRVAPPETAVRTTAPAGKPLFSSSPLFTIVHYCSPLFSKKYCPAPVSSQTVLLGANQDPTMVFTKHESRDTKHGFFSNHRLDSLPTIAHHCPLLPGIARGKILSCASVLVPPGRCFPARCGAARAAMARHGRPPSPAPATRPVRFSRITAFMLPYSPFPTISRYFPALFGPPTPNRSRVRPPSTVLSKPQDERRSPPLPPPSGLLPAAAKDR